MPDVVRVLVLEEFCGDGKKTYVAQAIEEDIATQVSPGSTLTDVVEALGYMFDATDAITLAERATRPPPAPSAYEHAWEKNSFLIGDMRLGKFRKAAVRLLRDSYAIAIAGRKRPEIVKHR